MAQVGDKVLGGAQALTELPDAQCHDHPDVPAGNGAGDGKNPAD